MIAWLSNLRGDIIGGIVSAVVATPLAMGYGMFAFVALGESYFASGALAGLYTAFIVAIVCVLFGDKSTTVYAPRITSTFFLGLVGRNVRIETRWVAGSVDKTRQSAAELVALSPEVILATGSVSAGPLLQATRSIPIVLVHTPDPVGAGFVNSMSRPGGNATGFINFEYGMGAKWLELLKQIVPSVTRAAIVRDPAHYGRDRPVGRDPERSAVAWDRSNSRQHARRRRDRVRRCGLRRLPGRRHDRDWERISCC
jgi:hypothetical protein